WSVVADPLVTYEGMLPIAAVCALHLYRHRDTVPRQPREFWYEGALIGASAVALGAGTLALRLIGRAGGFVVTPPVTTFAQVHTLYTHVWVTVQSVLKLYGADFSGKQDIHAAPAVICLAGVALATWAACRAVRRFTEQDLVTRGPERRRRTPRDRRRAADRRGPGRPPADRAAHQRPPPGRVRRAAGLLRAGARARRGAAAGARRGQPAGRLPGGPPPRLRRGGVVGGQRRYAGQRRQGPGPAGEPERGQRAPDGDPAGLGTVLVRRQQARRDVPGRAALPHVVRAGQPLPVDADARRRLRPAGADLQGGRFHHRRLAREPPPPHHQARRRRLLM